MILIAIGANLPAADGTPPLAVCRRAATALGAVPGLRLVAVSRFYRTAPVPASAQPDYINAAARLEGDVTPETLLRALQAMEAAAGRVRGARNAARVLDLDIIDVDGMVRAAPDPVLPHPRAHLRGFVLRPVADVAPGWVHPVLGLPVEALIGALADQQEAVVAA